MKLIQHTKLVATLSLVITGTIAAVPQELVDGLGDENYQLREKAEQDLTLWAKKKGQKGLDDLSALKKKVQSPEVKSRLDNVMSGVTIYKSIPGTQGFMGISMQAVMGGSVILGVSPDTPAAKSELQPNDKIIELDGVDLRKKNNHVDEATDFLRGYVKSKKSGEKLTIKIDRNGKIMTKTLKLADYDKQMARLEGRLDPFGGFNNGGIQIPPMQGGGIQRNFRFIPRPRNREIDPKQLMEIEKQRLELNLKNQERLLEQAELPDEIKDMFRRQKLKNQNRLEQLKKELNLKEKQDPDK